MGERQPSDFPKIRFTTPQDSYGEFLFIADHPEGPFRPANNYRFLMSRGTHFALFYKMPGGEILMNHHSIELAGEHKAAWMPPLKKVITDQEGNLQLAYWKGNDQVKGKEIQINLHNAHTIHSTKVYKGIKTTDGYLEVDAPDEGRIVDLDIDFNPNRGLVLEGILEVYEPQGFWSGFGFHIPYENTAAYPQTVEEQRGTGMIMESRGKTEFGLLYEYGTFIADDIVEMGITAGKDTEFRLLFRHSVMELYLDDLLVHCFSMPKEAYGNVKLVFESGRFIVRKLKAWEMNF